MGVIIARGRLRFQGVCFCIITQKRLVKGIQGHFFLDARCSWHARGDLIMYGQTRECGDKPHANELVRSFEAACQWFTASLGGQPMALQAPGGEPVRLEFTFGETELLFR